MRGIRRGTFSLLPPIALISRLLAWSPYIMGQEPEGETGAGGIAHSLEVSASDDTLEARHLREVGFLTSGPTGASGGFFFNETRGLVASVDALARVTPGADERGFVLQVGGRLYGVVLNAEDEDVLGLGLGGEVRYTLPDRSLSMALDAFYAPDIVVFGEADGIVQASLRIEAPPRNEVTLFVGYSTLEARSRSILRSITSSTTTSMSASDVASDLAAPHRSA